MAVTKAYYLEVYGGYEYDDLEDLLKRAEQAVRCIISAEPVPDTEQEICYKNAVCAQAEYIGTCGGISSWLACQQSGGGFTIGSFSMSGSSSGAGQGSSGSTGDVPYYTRSWLEKGGLIYRGVDAI